MKVLGHFVHSEETVHDTAHSFHTEQQSYHGRHNRAVINREIPVAINLMLIHSSEMCKMNISVEIFYKKVRMYFGRPTWCW
jgi:hypothetical protein